MAHESLIESGGWHMVKQHRSRLGLFIGILLMAGVIALSGCSRAKPKLSQALPTAEPGTSPAASMPTTATTPDASLPTFRLKAPVGSAPEQVSGPAFAVVIENCDSDNPLVQEHTERVHMASSLLLDLGAAELDAHAADIERMVRNAYGIDHENGHQVTDTTSIQVEGRHQATVQLRWNAIWDRNSVEVVRDGAVVAELPVRALMEVDLEALESEMEPCAPALELLPAPTATPDAAQPLEESEQEALPGSDEAIALVRDYVRALAEGRLEDAYAFLHPTYQERYPYERWSLGYAPITDIEIRAIESMRINAQTDEVVAGLTLTKEVGGRPSYTDWKATYRVIVTRGHPPYQRTIVDIRMRPMGVG
jgi:hypothetical protein